MRLGQLALVAGDRQDMLRPVHVVVGCRRDVGPVRLDVAQVQAPRRVAGLFHELDRARRHVGRFAVILADRRSLAGVFQEPARGQFLGIVAFAAAVREVVPWVRASIALVTQPVVVDRRAILFVIEPVWPLGAHAVVAFPDVEAALLDPGTDHAVAVDAQPGHALVIRLHVGLAHQPAVHPGVAQMIAHRAFADLQRHTVPGRPMRMHVAPGVEAHPRGAADR